MTTTVYTNDRGVARRYRPHQRHPVHAFFAQFTTVPLVLALATDIAYWGTANLMYKNFSSWLLFVGVVMAVLAAIAGIIDLFARRDYHRRNRKRSSAIHGIGSVAVLVLALLNNFIHAGDGWTAIVPWGLTVSALTVLALIVTSWSGYTASDDVHAGARP